MDHRVTYSGNTSWFNDLRQMQVFGVETLFRELKDEFNPNNVIEIGTAFAGLTNLLAVVFDELTVHSFDITDLSPKKAYLNNIKFYLDDCHKEEFLENHKDILFSNGTTLFVIDGGDKALEINLISKHAKSGDILMVHDFATDNNVFENKVRSIWNCLEIQENQINIEHLKRSKMFDRGLDFAWGIYERL